MAPIRLMHYVNQFFAGVGGEDKTSVPLDFREGVVGPGKRLASLCAGSAQIVSTAYCGDNYFVEHRDEVLQKILEHARAKGIDVVVAGPAFAAGRYGFACMEVCHFLCTSLSIYGVTSMSVENPGVDGYKQYKNQKVFLFPASEAATGMEATLSRIAQFVSKLASGSTIGSAAKEGYLPRGIRVDVEVSERGAERAIKMLLKKLGACSFETEIPFEIFEKIPVAPPLSNTKDACIAIASTSGVTTEGNPYRFKMFRNEKFEKHLIGKLNSMKEMRWDVLHGGYGTSFMLSNPNYGVPLDACRELEREGAFAKLHPYFYGTTGVDGTISAMQEIGRKMVADMKAEGVNAVLLVST